MIKSINLNFNFLLFGLALTSIPNEDLTTRDSNIQYAIVAVYLFFFIFSKRIFQIKDNVGFKNLDLIPLTFIIIWIYGIIIGYINEVPQIYLFRNFAGMFVYVVYYTFRSYRIDVNIIYKTISWVALIGFFELIYILIRSLSTGSILLVTGERLLFCALQFIVFIPFCVILGNLFFPVGNFKRIFYTNNKLVLAVISILSFVMSVIVSFSKGMILSAGAIIAFLIVTRILKGVNKKFGLMIFLVILMIFVIVVQFDLYETLEELFSGREVSNETRNIQLDYIVNDFKFMGNGLGSGLTNSYYTRADDAPYAFELSFVNIIHKFGVLAIPLFYGYLKTFYVIFKSLGNDAYKNLGSLFALALMIYIFPSIGNPFLFAPLCVFCHCLALYILRQTSYRINNIKMSS
jgi:hypothetical protein